MTSYDSDRRIERGSQPGTTEFLARRSQLSVNERYVYAALSVRVRGGI